MKLWSRTLIGAAALLAGALAATTVRAEDDADKEMIMVPTAAVLPFEARSRQAETNNEGKSISELVSIALMESGVADMVERAELEKALAELQLSSSGMTDKESQVKLGKLIGAKILVTGSLFRAGDQNYITAKVIGTETSRVVGCSVSGSQDYVALVPELATKLSGQIEKNAAKLLPKIPSQAGVLDALKDTVKGGGRKLFIQVTENINTPAPDPAAATALQDLALKLGFTVVPNRTEADFALIGEAVASPADNYTRFVSAESRVELSLYDKNQKLLATGAVKDTLAGATYIVTAKQAIAQGALRLARDLFPAMK